MAKTKVVKDDKTPPTSWNREEGRGASAMEVGTGDGGHGASGASFYGGGNGRNDVGGRDTVQVKQPTKPTL